MKHLKVPFISIIVPVFNSEKTLTACIKSLLDLDYPSDSNEIIFIDDGSTDNTSEILKNYPVKVIKTKNQGPSIARNIGIKEASGNFVAFTDSDCIVKKNWLNALLNGFENDEKTAAVGGNQLAVDDDPPFAKRIQKMLELLGFLQGYTKNYTEITSVEHNASCNVMYRKSCIEEIGGFLPGLFPGEDVELDYCLQKSGYSIKYAPESQVFHHRPENIKKFFKMMFNYGKSSGGFMFRRYGFTRSFQLFFPLFIVLLIAELLLLFNNGIFFILFNLLLFFLTAAFIQTKIRDLTETIYLCMFVIVTLLAWNIGFVRGLFWKIHFHRKIKIK